MSSSTSTSTDCVTFPSCPRTCSNDDDDDRADDGDPSAGAAEGSDTEGEGEKRGNAEKRDSDRGTRSSNRDGDGATPRGRPTHKKGPACSCDNVPRRQEDRVQGTSENPLEAPYRRVDGLEEETRLLSLPETVRAAIDERGDVDGGQNGITGLERTKTLYQRMSHRRDFVPVLDDGGSTGGLVAGGEKPSRVAGSRNSGAADERLEAHNTNLETGRTKWKSSPRTTAPEAIKSATEAAYPPLEVAMERSPSTTDGPVCQQCETRSKNRVFHNEGVERAAVQHQKRTEQAKRLALEVARLRSALRGSNSDLAAERKARARLEDELWQKLQTWEHERGVIVYAKHEAELVLRTAKEELDMIRKQTEAPCAKAKTEATAREALHRKAEIALNGVVTVQDRLVRALQTEVDLTNRARETAQEDAREAREQLRLYVGHSSSWPDRANLLEARIAELGQPQPLIYNAQAPSRAQLTSSVRSAQNHEAEARCAKGGEVRRSAERSVAWKDQEFLARNRLVERAGEDGSSGGKDISCQQDVTGAQSGNPRDAVEAQHKSGFVLGGGDQNVGACLMRTKGLVDDDKLLLVLKGSKGDTKEKYLADTAAVATSSRSREYFQRSMRAQQDISARIEKDLARARSDLKLIYASDGTISSTVGVTDTTDAAVSSGNRDDNGCCVKNEQGVEGGTGNPQKAAREGDGSDRETKHHASVEVPGPHLARVLAALLGVETTTRSRVNNERKSVWRKPDRSAKGSGDSQVVSRSIEPPRHRLSDYPPPVQAIFRGEPATSPPPTGVPTLLNAKTASPALPRPPRESLQRGATACVEEGGPTPPVARGDAEGCAVAVAFREYEPKSPLLQRWLAERHSAASPN